MPDVAKVRWYRHGGRRPLCVMLLWGLSIVPALLIVHGVGHPVHRGLINAGAVLLLAIAISAAIPMRAGIGVTQDRLLMRTASSTTAIPWAEVLGFEGGKDDPKSRHNDTIFVLTSDGQRRPTVGYAPRGASPAELWLLLRALEDERLARVPGSASTLPPPLPPSRTREDAASAKALCGIVAIGLLGAGILLLFGSIGKLEPALRAAHGEGTVGYYVPQRETTGKAAQWYGDFQLPDGVVILRDVGLADTSRDALQAGVPVAALDTGDTVEVFRPGDSEAWRSPADDIVVVAWLYTAAVGLFIWLAFSWLRSDRRNRNSSTPDAASRR